MNDQDPTLTPQPKRIRREPTPSGRYTFRPEDIQALEHACLHEETIGLVRGWEDAGWPVLIDDVRQARKRRWPILAMVITLAVGSIGTLATCVYTQGAAAGATQIQVEALEARALEDRVEAGRRAEQQRQTDALEVQRHTELLRALHAIDSRLGRLEERSEGATKRSRPQALVP
jgi:hypothetical protein